MERYRNLGGDSGVRAFDLGAGYIRVKFSDGATYLYNNSSAGTHHILTMQQLAVDGRGLNGYISRFVKKGYASKSRF